MKTTRGLLTSNKLTDRRYLRSIQFVCQQRGLLASLGPGLPAIGGGGAREGSVRRVAPGGRQEADQLLRLVLAGHALQGGAGGQLGGRRLGDRLQAQPHPLGVLGLVLTGPSQHLLRHDAREVGRSRSL